MIAPKPHTAELAEQPRNVERAKCPKCGSKIAVRHEAGCRILEYHHDPKLGYYEWCGGSDMNLDEDKSA